MCTNGSTRPKKWRANKDNNVISVMIIIIIMFSGFFEVSYKIWCHDDILDWHTMKPLSPFHWLINGHFNLWLIWIDTIAITNVQHEFTGQLNFFVWSKIIANFLGRMVVKNHLNYDLMSLLSPYKDGTDAYKVL